MPRDLQAATSLHAREIRGLRFGMSLKEVKRLIKKQDKKVVPVEINCSIPLGLDFYDGLPVFTRDTGVMLLATYGYDALYFHDDKLIALRKICGTSTSSFPEKELHGGSFSTHRFPKEQTLRTVFEMEDGGKYGFTNRYFDYYLFDDQARRDAISRVRGSFCWHIKLTSPNLPRYPRSTPNACGGRGAWTSSSLVRIWSSATAFAPRRRKCSPRRNVRTTARRPTPWPSDSIPPEGAGFLGRMTIQPSDILEIAMRAIHLPFIAAVLCLLCVAHPARAQTPAGRYRNKAATA